MEEDSAGENSAAVMNTETPRKRALEPTPEVQYEQDSPIMKQPRKETASEDKLTVFITSVTGSIYGHCLKSSVNIHKELNEIVGGETLKNLFISKKGKYVKVLCNNEVQKGRLMKTGEIKGYPVKVTEPFSLLGFRPSSKYPPPKPRFRAVVRNIPTDISENNLIEESGASNVKILPNKDGTYATAVISYDNPEIPDSVAIDGVDYETEGYVPRPLRCDKCQRFGHHKSECKASKAICSFCAGQHEYLNCDNRTDFDKAKCVNCGDNHSSAYRKCPKYLETKKALELRAVKKITYKQAKSKLHNYIIT